MSDSTNTSEAITSYIQYSNKLLERIHELETALLDASFLVQDWASYASPYFIEKHDLEGDLENIKRVLNRRTHGPTTSH